MIASISPLKQSQGHVGLTKIKDFSPEMANKNLSEDIKNAFSL